MSSLAWKNLIHDRVRLTVTLTGIVFSLVLILVQFGLFLGFLDTNGNIIAHGNADLWISATGIPHVNAGAPIPERRRYQALSVPGVARVDRARGFVGGHAGAGRALYFKWFRGAG